MRKCPLLEEEPCWDTGIDHFTWVTSLH